MGMTTVVITHNSSISEVADKVITIKNGTVDNIKINKRPKKVSEIEWWQNANKEFFKKDKEVIW